MPRGRGFTLVEVLVALAIVAIALAAAGRSVALSTDSAMDHKLRVLAGFVAENRMAELAARRAWAGIGVTEGTESQAGIDFRWRAEVVATPHPRLRRVEIHVADPADSAHELRRLVGVLSREF
ncbi:MAG: type II secretion system minor pseudopilin GspI [Betaproteobacteria bacterium]|nr:type II secretion system minor pseudopilin GspI [Betaproteobacteria bacterium]